jgi:hypothetical protein
MEVSREESAVQNATDWRQVPVAFAQFLRILQAPFLAHQQLPQRFGGVRLPNSEIAIVTSTENEARVAGISHSEHMLHSFGKVYIAGFALSTVKDSHCIIIAAGAQFMPSWREADAEHWTNVSMI